MIIIDKSSPLTAFGLLEVGDIFRDPVDNDVMMKISPISVDDKTNTVSLKNGEGYDFEDSYEVMHIDATLNIH